jgi:hypothetical protein
MSEPTSIEGGNKPREAPSESSRFDIEMRAHAEAVRETMDYLVDHQGPPPDHIYHYTTGVGFYGIVDSGTIWATDLEFVNDQQELLHGRVLAASILKEHADTQIDLLGLLDPFSVPSLLKSNVEVLKTPPRFLLAYSAAFSTLKDDLSQWRAYAPQGGFMLKVDTAKLTRLNEAAGFRLLRCYYEEKDQRRLVEALRDRVLPDLEAIESNRPDSQQDTRVIAADLRVRATFDTLAAVLKHPSFEAEREWRLVAPSLKLAPEVRCRGWHLVPYVSGKIRESTDQSIAGIWVGPAPNQSLNAKAAKVLLLKHQLIDLMLKVNVSAVPFRTL